MDLAYAARGEGSPALLLHSGGMSGRQWRALGDRLAARHRVIAPDLLGSGANPPWPADAPFHFQQDVDAVARIASDLAPAHLVGHSYGGLLALTLARQAPGRVRSVAVYDPVAFGVLHDAGDAEGLADLARAEVDPVLHDEARGGGEAWWEAFVDYWNGPGAFRALPAPSREAFLRVGRKVFLEVTSLVGDRTPRAAYAPIAAPVLVLTGERSPPAARRVAAVLAAALPDARAGTVPGAGHMGPLTHADAVNAAIEAHRDAADRRGA